MELTASDSKVKVIGILDDEENFLANCEKALIKHDNVQAFTTTNYREALNWVNKGLVDIMAIDYDLKLGEINGLDVMKKASEVNNRIKYSIVTNNPDADVEAYCEEQGFGFITKTNVYRNIVRNISDLREEAGTDLTELLADHTETRKMLDSLIEPIIKELELIDNQEDKLVVPDYGELSVRDLIEEIRDRTDLGKEYIEIWGKTQNTILKLKSKKKGGWNVFK